MNKDVILWDKLKLNMVMSRMQSLRDEIGGPWLWLNQLYCDFWFCSVHQVGGSCQTNMIFG